MKEDEFRDKIKEESAQQAFDTLLEYKNNNKKYRYEIDANVMVTYKFYHTDNFVFSLVITKGALLFHIRKPAIDARILSFIKIPVSFKEISQKKTGEWTIKVEDQQDAETVITEILDKFS